MTQSSIDPSNSPPSNVPFQVLAAVLSVGMHYIIASNLGLFDRLIPVPIKPVGGTVKAVDLTAAEQSRVPEAAKAKPLPVNPIQSGTEQATQPIPNAASPGVMSGNAPRNNNSNPTPQRSARSTPQVNQPGILPKPSKTIRKTDPGFKVDRSRKLPDITAKTDGSENQNDRQGSKGGRSSRTTQLDSQTGIDSQNPSSPSPTKSPSPTTLPSSPSPTKSPPSTTPPSKSQSYAAVKKEFDQAVQAIKNSPDVEIMPNEAVPPQNYPSGACTSIGNKVDRYVIVGITLRYKESNPSSIISADNDGKGEIVDIEIRPKGEKEFSGEAVDIAEKYAQSQYSRLTQEQKKARKGKRLYYEKPIVFQASTCPRNQ
jgi:hypothetical protein